MKKLIFIIAFSCCNIAFAQKVDVKDNIITVDGNPYAKIERDGNLLTAELSFTISSISTGKKLMVIAMQNIFLPERKSWDNPDGRVTYSKFVFLDSADHVCEADISFLKNDKLAKYIVKNNLIINGELNAPEVKTFALVKGKPFSERGGVKLNY